MSEQLRWDYYCFSDDDCLCLIRCERVISMIRWKSSLKVCPNVKFKFNSFSGRTVLPSVCAQAKCTLGLTNFWTLLNLSSDINAENRAWDLLG